MDTTPRRRARPRWLWLLALVTFFLGFVLAGELLGAERSCISVRVTNGHSRTIHRAFGPATLMADVRVQRDPEHRRLEVRWAHPDSQHSTSFGDASTSIFGIASVEENPATGSEGAYEKDLDGADERVLHQVRMPGLAGGTYDITASVYRNRDKRNLCGRANARVVVTSPFDGAR